VSGVKRVLVVDDEARVVDALGRSLRSERRYWSVTTATSGAQAVDLLEAEPFDAILSDMLMPGMDGVELLGWARERRPEALRIVLSGHTGPELALRTLPVAHQFRAKPCNGAELKSTIARGLMFHDLVDDPVLRRAVGHVAALPSPSRTTDRLPALLDDAATPVDTIASALVEDVAATAKLLQIVNSSFFGLPVAGQAGVSTAVRYLGVECLRAIFLEGGLLLPPAGAAADGAALATLARHSLLVATVARELTSDRSMADAAFAAGLVHAIGRLVLAAELPDDFVSVPEDGDEPPEVRGATVNQLGASLLAMWGLPQPIVEAVARNHMAPLIAGSGDGPVVEITDAVYLADVLVRSFDRDQNLPTSFQDELVTFGLTERLPALEALMVRTAARMQDDHGLRRVS